MPQDPFDLAFPEAPESVNRKPIVARGSVAPKTSTDPFDTAFPAADEETHADRYNAAIAQSEMTSAEGQKRIDAMPIPAQAPTSPTIGSTLNQVGLGAERAVAEQVGGALHAVSAIPEFLEFKKTAHALDVGAEFLNKGLEDKDQPGNLTEKIAAGVGSGIPYVAEKALGAPPAALFGLPAFGNTYNDARQSGRSHAQSAIAAGTSAVFNTMVFDMARRIPVLGKWLSAEGAKPIQEALKHVLETGTTFQLMNVGNSVINAGVKSGLTPEAAKQAWDSTVQEALPNLATAVVFSIPNAGSAYHKARMNQLHPEAQKAVKDAVPGLNTTEESVDKLAKDPMNPYHINAVLQKATEMPGTVAAEAQEPVTEKKAAKKIRAKKNVEVGPLGVQVETDAQGRTAEDLAGQKKGVWKTSQPFGDAEATQTPAEAVAREPAAVTPATAEKPIPAESGKAAMAGETVTRPVVEFEGKKFYGQPGDEHADIIRKANRDGAKIPSDEYANEKYRKFETSTGKVVGRETAAKMMGEEEPLHSARLYEIQAEREKANANAKPSAEGVPVGERAGGGEGVRETHAEGEKAAEKEAPKAAEIVQHRDIHGNLYRVDKGDIDSGKKLLRVYNQFGKQMYDADDNMRVIHRENLIGVRKEGVEDKGQANDSVLKAIESRAKMVSEMEKAGYKLPAKQPSETENQKEWSDAFKRGLRPYMADEQGNVVPAWTEKADGTKTMKTALPTWATPPKPEPVTRKAVKAKKPTAEKSIPFAKVVDAVGRNDMHQLLYNWNDVELNEDGTGMKSYTDRRTSLDGKGGADRVGVKEFYAWLKSDRPDSKEYEQDDEWKDLVSRAREAAGIKVEKPAPVDEPAAQEKPADVEATPKAETVEKPGVGGEREAGKVAAGDEQAGPEVKNVSKERQIEAKIAAETTRKKVVAQPTLSKRIETGEYNEQDIREKVLHVNANPSRESELLASVGQAREAFNRERQDDVAGGSGRGEQARPAIQFADDYARTASGIRLQEIAKRNQSLVVPVTGLPDEVPAYASRGNVFINANDANAHQLIHELTHIHADRKTPEIEKLLKAHDRESAAFREQMRLLQDAPDRVNLFVRTAQMRLGVDGSKPFTPEEEAKIRTSIVGQMAEESMARFMAGEADTGEFGANGKALRAAALQRIMEPPKTGKKVVARNKGESENGKHNDVSEGRSTTSLHEGGNKNASLAENKPAAPATTETTAQGIKVETDPATGDKTVSVPAKDKKGIDLKEQKRYMLAELDKAIEAAPIVGKVDPKILAAWKEEHGDNFGKWFEKHSKNADKAGKVTIEIPGDGQFTLVEDKGALTAFRERAQRQFPTTVPRPDMPRRVGGGSESKSARRMSIENLTDDGIRAYGDATKAADEYESYVKSLKGTGEGSQYERALHTDAVKELRSRAERTSNPTEQTTSGLEELSNREFKARQEEEALEERKRYQIGVDALKQHPRFVELQKLMAKKGIRVETDGDDLLNKRVYGSGSGPIRALQDAIAEDMGLMNWRKINEKRNSGAKDFDLSKYEPKEAKPSEATLKPKKLVSKDKAQEASDAFAGEKYRLVNRESGSGDQTPPEATATETPAAPATKETKEPWQMSEEDYAFSKGVSKPSIEINPSASRHQLSSMSERAKNDMAKERIVQKSKERAEYYAKAAEWESGVWNGYLSEKFSANDVFDTDAFGVLQNKISEKGIDIESPFKLRKMTDADRKSYLDEIDAKVRSATTESEPPAAKEPLAPKPVRKRGAVEAETPAASATGKDLVDRSIAMFRRRRTDPVTAKEAQDLYAEMKANVPALEAEVMARINADPKNKGKRQATKQDMAKKIVQNQLEKFGYLDQDVFGYEVDDMNDYQGSKMRALDKHVAELTDEKIKAMFDKRNAESLAYTKAIDNPETLEEFEKKIAYHGEEALSPEQKIKYDALRAEAGMTRREESKIEKQGTVSQVEGATNVPMEIVERPHSKRGNNVFIVKMGARVDGETFKELATKARRLGGNWSREWKPTDSPAGFMFNDRKAAEDFMALRQGDVSKTEEVASSKEETREAAADRLAAMADKMEESGSEELGRDRLANTSRRAAMADTAERRASGQIELAKTIKNIAAAMRSGDSKFLKNVSTRAQIETLQSIANRTREYLPRDQGHGPVRPELAEFPVPKMRRDNMPSMIRDLYNAGAKLASKQLKSLYGKTDGEGMTEVPDELARKIRDVESVRSAWYVDDRLTESDRLRRMNITNDAELRSALREYLTFKGEGPKQDTAQALRRKLVGQNVGVDYFPTPPALASELVRKANIRSGDTVLEPSAGDGQIANQVRLQHPDTPVNVVEQSGALRDILKAEGHNLVDSDFMEHGDKYDRIVMNPPFSNNMDIEHVRHAYDLLNPGGRIVAVMSEHGFFANGKTEQEFRDWMDKVGGESEKNPSGSFMDKTIGPNTGVATRTVVIDKPMGKMPLMARDTDKGVVMFSRDESQKPKPTTTKETATNEIEDAETRKLVQEVSQKISQQINAPYRFIAVRPDSLQLSAAEMGVLQKMEDVFGKKVVFIHEDAETRYGMGGFNSPLARDVLFINARTTKPHLQIIGHEFLHSLKRDAPDLYENFSRAVGPFVKQSEFEKAFQSFPKTANLDRSGVVEEIHGDALGNAMLQPKLWNDLEKKNPSLFRQMASYAVKWLSSLKKEMSSFINKFDVAKRYFSDVDSLNSHLTDMLAKYGERKALQKRGAMKETPVTLTDESVKMAGETPRDVAIDRALKEVDAAQAETSKTTEPVMPSAGEPIESDGVRWSDVTDRPIDAKDYSIKDKQRWASEEEFKKDFTENADHEAHETWQEFLKRRACGG